MDENPETKNTECVIITQKLTNNKQLHMLISKGGEILLNDKFGVKILPQGEWVNIQIIVYNETPKFKYKTYYNQSMTTKKKEANKDVGLKISQDVDLFEAIK